MSQRLRLPLAAALVVAAAAAPVAGAPEVPWTPIAGTVPGLAGDGGPATQARLADPGGQTVLGDGSVLIADTGNSRIRRIAPNGIITTVAGDDDGLAGDGGPASAALLSFPTDVAATPDGGYLIADAGNDRIRKVSATGIITTIAGTDRGFLGDGGPAVAAKLDTPRELALQADGGILVADAGNDRVRRIAPNGVITTVAGGGAGGDGGPATQARLDEPSGVAVMPDGGFLIADTGNGRIRRVTPNGVITTFAGTTSGFAGDAGRAGAAELARPSDVVTLPNGGALIADTGNGRIRRVTPLGAIFTVTSGIGSPTAITTLAGGGALLSEASTGRIGRIPGLGRPPDPTEAQSIGVDRTQGAVTVTRGPGGDAVPLEEPDLAVNRSSVDATRGRIALTVQRRRGVGLATADVGGGTFTVRQSATGDAIADLTLTGAITGCPAPRSAAGRAQEDAKPRKRKRGNRRIDIRVKGKYRTRGDNASAIASGTRWIMIDACDRTVITVTEGVVKVRDYRLDRVVRVKAGRTYVALSRAAARAAARAAKPSR
ncbi:MAG: hypothetical protein AB7O78_12090 [Thermoleophilia bacterium]